MIPVDTLLLFLVTTFVVVLSPGPAVITVTSEAISSGYKQAFWLTLGIAIANVGFFVLSATGIATLILTSSTLFLTIKWIGVAYLLYLGFHALFSRSGPLKLSARTQPNRPVHRAFLRGFILELANPKALLYFSALLPQFINVDEAIFPQLTIFCLITFCLDLICYSLYGYLGRQSTLLSDKPWVTKSINRFAGSMLIFAGLKMAVIER